MTRLLLYVAHPLSPTPEEIESERKSEDMIGGPAHGAEAVAAYESEISRRSIGSNLKRAMRWLHWLRMSFQETTFIAPWIASVLAGADDHDPAQRSAGIIDNLKVIERCDGIVLCGPRISSGMRMEMEHGMSCVARCSHNYGFDVHDLTGVENIPVLFNQGPHVNFTFEQWAIHLPKVPPR